MPAVHRYGRTISALSTTESAETSFFAEAAGAARIRHYIGESLYQQVREDGVSN